MLFFQISKLTLGKDYQFRVAAENRFGRGPFVSSEKVVVKFPFNKPGCPGIPKVPLMNSICIKEFFHHIYFEQAISVSCDSVSLVWHEPTHDGGSPVIAYHVAYRERNEMFWSKANNMDITNTRYTVKGLEVRNNLIPC